MNGAIAADALRGGPLPRDQVKRRRQTAREFNLAKYIQNYVQGTVLCGREGEDRR
jgi:hypothetical protein